MSASDITIKRTVNRIQVIADAIEQRFTEIKKPEKIKLKHMLYIKNHWYESQNFSTVTIEDYKRSMRLMITALSREHWLFTLDLKKDLNKGGRPTVGRVIRSKAR
ncbi:MAG: hypothetical protein WBH20_06530 [Oceanisphaera sp.]|uniref:hypothetical protein n=1 Tax=Oceanisphaera sp. TaxID=1929979 RepID=UPI003C739E53